MSNQLVAHEVPRSRVVVFFHQAVWALAGLCAALVVCIAAWLRPDARGYGTHTQLGLPPCGFQAATGVPCPGCGLTTSFAWMAHGHFLRAFGAHLMGPVLFLTTVLVALYAPWAVARRRPLSVIFELRAVPPLVGSALVLGLLTWGLRLAHAFL